MFETCDLSPMVLPEDSGLRRDPALSPKGRGPDFAGCYDWTTLAYGAAWTPGGIVLSCPKLLNLAPLVRRGRFHSAAGEHPFRAIRRYRRHDEVWLEARAAGPELVLETAGLRLSCPVQRPWATGRRCLVTTSKDNDLLWIADWAAHHVRHQGTEAVLLHDNLSAAYAPQDILETLRAVPGLVAARVVSVPCRYGPLGRTRPRGKAKFLQTGLLNLARHGALADARSVLQCDVDEIAVSDPGAPGLHEAAERSRLGYATAPAFWRGAQAGGRLPRHGDHILGWVPERTSKEKWCVVPGGKLGGFAWDVHGIGRYQFNRLAMRRDIRFYHCEALSTDWKRPRAGRLAEGARPDPATEAALRRAGLPG